jgi:hypothetical protein
MMKRLFSRNPSLALGLGYLVGQGSVFLFQFIAKIEHANEFLGLTVIFVSLVSFALQFSDFGNSTYVSRKVINGEQGVDQFLFSRAVLGFLLCSCLSIAAYAADLDSSLLTLLVLLPLIGVVCALQAYGVLEAHGRYVLIAFLQALPWLAMAALFLSLLQLDQTHLNLIPFVLLALCAWLLLFSRRQLAKEARPQPFQPSSRRRWWVALPYVSGPLGGQVWGRVVIFYVSSSVGLASVGDYGIMRNVQIASLLLLGFLMRPILRDYLAQWTDRCESGARLPSLLAKYKTVLALSFLGPATAALLNVSDINSMYLSGWGWLLLGMPMTVVQLACVQCNQVDCGSRLLLGLDALSLSMNVFTFFLFSSFSVVLAIVMGELVQCIASLGGRRAFARYW